MKGHPDLAALERHSAEPDAACEAHVAACEVCRATLSALAEHAALGGQLRAALRREPSGNDAPTPPRIDGYEKLRLISLGGQGVVWRAWHRATRRDVALKLLVGAAYASPRTRARFEREIELAASLHHPNIVAVFDSGASGDGAQWFAMEFIDGRPFVRWARESRAQPEREVLRCFVQLCGAVDSAHRRGVIHRDLKSSNVLVDAEGAPHVLDFGLAAPRAADHEDEPRLTHTGEFMGTLAYASPEHVSGDPRSIDVRSDVYSLGVLLYEALTGRLPRDVSGSTHAAAHRIASHEIDRAPLRGMSVDLATVISTALARDPERRYSTAGALGEDVQRVLDGHAIDARRDSALYVLRKTFVRYRVQVAVAGFVFLFAVVSAVVSTSLWRRAERNRQLAVLEAERANELSGFWRSLFDAIDPERVEGRRLDVREVLDDAARRMRESPPRSEFAEMELAASIGRTYHKLDRNEFAWQHLERATELAQRTLPENDARIDAFAADAATLALAAAPLDVAQGAVARLEGLALAPYTLGYIRAQLAQREGDDEQSLAEMTRALEALDGSESPSDILGAFGVLMEMSDRADEHGEFDAAAGFARRAVALAERYSGPLGTRALQAKFRLALSIETRGEGREAVELLDEVVEGYRRRYGQDDTATLNADVARAILRGRIDGRETVRADLTRLAAFRAALFARQDKRSATVLAALADLARDLGQLQLALALQEDRLAILTQLGAEAARELGTAYVGLADLCVARRDAERALRCADDALANFGDAHGSVTIPLIRAHIARATALALLGRADEAEPAARRAVELAGPVGGDRKLSLGAAMRALALSQSMTGDLAAAEATTREALAALEAGPSSGADVVAALLDDLGDVLIQAFRPAEAEVALRDALERRRRVLGPQHPDTASTATKLGTALFEQRKGPPDLPGLWTEALAVLEACDTEHPAYASALNNLGAWAHIVEQDPARAEAFFRRGLEVGERVHGARNLLLAPSLANVAMYDLQHGDVPAATQRVERALAIMEPVHGADHPRVKLLRDMLADCQRRSAAADGG